MSKLRFQTPTGMKDILPEDYKYYDKIYQVVLEMADFYGFGRIETPIVEQEELFSTGVGEATDIVKKEMYSFKTRGGDELALRPEATAPIARAYIQNGMQSRPQPVKFWYFGPFFRHEKPQSGRYRQFWQFGFEVLGEQNAVIDAQIIQIFYNILKELKLKNLSVAINSMGDGVCRPHYKKVLANYFKSREASLCSDCKRRLKENVLRILDCVEEKCQPLKSDAPQILNHLCDECRLHFKEVLEYLEEIELPYTLSPYLVRGLDYYTKTVFEIFGQDIKESQNKDNKGEGAENKEKEGGISLQALAGGGRYDKLVKSLGGRDIPGCGAAAGVERIINLMKSQESKPFLENNPKVFLAQLGDLAKRKGLKLFEDFRKANISIAESFGRDSLKTQLGRADRLGVSLVLILGQKESLEGVVIIRDMATGKQDIVKLDRVVEEVKKQLRK